MNNQSIALYEFEDNEIRVSRDENGDPLFVAIDVCKALGIADVGRAMSRLDEDEKGVRLTHTPGGTQNLSIVNESGLYNLVLSSRKPKAKAFKRWMTHEVLPAIRKQGGYISPDASREQIAKLQDQLNNARQALRLFGVRTGAGRFLESTLPRRDRD